MRCTKPPIHGHSPPFSEAPTSLMTAAEPTTPWEEESEEPRPSTSTLQPTDPTIPPPKPESVFDKLQLLVSLDTALELIHADRESLKRVEAFRGYQGKYGKKVQETLEEVFILLLQSIGTRHIAPGFRRWVRTFLRIQSREVTSPPPTQSHKPDGNISTSSTRRDDERGSTPPILRARTYRRHHPVDGASLF